MSDDNKRGRKNPWGGGDRNKERDTPWNGKSKGHKNGGKDPKDLDDFIKNAQDSLRDVMPGNMGGGFVLILFILAVIGLWLASGIHIINPGEHGVIQTFGKYTTTQESEGIGYHFPAPIQAITKINVNEQRSMTIGVTETTNKRGNNRASFAVPDESRMLTADRNIVDLTMTIQWDIKSAKDFLFQIKEPENTIKKVTESAIREVVGQTDMFPVITTGRDAIADRVKTIIQQNLDGYNAGVNIKQVLILKAEVHPEVQRAFQDVQSAAQDAENTQNVARAKREEILPIARGQAAKLLQEAEAYKQSKIAQASGDAQRFRAIYKAYLNGKDVTKERIYIETMEQVLSNAEKIILDSKGSGQGVVPYLPLKELKSKN